MIDSTTAGRQSTDNQNTAKASAEMPDMSAYISRVDMVALLDTISQAAVAHAEVGQLRDYSGEPYVVHPIEVVKILLLAGADAVTLKAGALHDVVEDTKQTSAMIQELFGREVSDLVEEVTNPEKPKGLSRAERKAMDRDHVAGASQRAQNLKCADVSSNINTGENNLAMLDPIFASTYLPEKLLQVQAMTKADHQLRDLALSRIHEGMAILQERGISLKCPKPSARQP